MDSLILSFMDKFVPRLGGWEGPIIISMGVLLALLVLSSFRLALRQSFYELAEMEIAIILRREATQGICSGGYNDERGARLQADLSRRIFAFTVVGVVISAGAIFSFSDFAFYRLSVFSNLNNLCDAGASCAELHLFTLDLLLKGIFIDLMESFGWHLSQVEYRPGLNPISVTVFLTRAAPAIVIVSYVTGNLKGQSQARQTALATAFENMHGRL